MDTPKKLPCKPPPTPWLRPRRILFSALYNRRLHMISTVTQGNQAFTTSDFENLKAEFGALASGCGVYDLSARAKLAITGNDRTRWLNGMVTNNIRDLNQGHGLYAFLLNPQGHILGDMYAYNHGDSLIVDTDQSQSEKIRATFDHFIIMDDVEVKDVSGEWIAVGLIGPKTAGVLRAIGLDLPKMKPLEFVEVRLRSIALTVVRGDNPSVESYEFWLSSDRAKDLQGSLVEAGATPVGASAIELLRIATGIPRYGQDIRERDLPQETEQQRALHFSKGCYIGQEIVERIRSRGSVHRTFTGFLVQGALPATGTKIQADGKDVGEITSATSLPLSGGDRPVALGYIRREVSRPGKQFQAGSSQISVALPPFPGTFGNETAKN